MRKVLPYLIFLTLGLFNSCQQNGQSYDEAEAIVEIDSFEQYEYDAENIYPSPEMEYDEYAYGDKNNSDRIKDYKTKPVSGTQIPKDEWKEKSKGVSYDENVKPIVEKAQEEEEEEYNSINNSQFFKVLSYSIGIIGIGLVLFFLIKNLLEGKYKSTVSLIQDYNFKEISEEDLKQLETESLIIKAENANDYKSAFRLRYLQLLKKLLELKWIRYKKDFTNRDYLNQLSQRKIVEPFAVLTLYFDSYWYGEINIDKEKYQKAVPKFEKIEHDLKMEAKA